MQELRLVAVSEDGLYAVLEVPGRSGRFLLPIDDRLRIVARGQFSRLAQYEIEVENPLRPKEIQDRIRAGETAEEIADAAGIPIERVRRFEGPVLAERAYRAQEAQAATVRRARDSGPGPRLGEVVAERMRAAGASPDDAEWDSRKRSDGTWLVKLAFRVHGQSQVAEWAYDPQRRHVSPVDDPAARLCLPEEDLPEPEPSRLAPTPTATVTPIATRLSAAANETGPPTQPASFPAGLPGAREGRPGREARREWEARPAAGEAQPAAREARVAAQRPHPATQEDEPGPDAQPARAAQARVAQGQAAQGQAAQGQAAQGQAAQGQAAQGRAAERQAAAAHGQAAQGQAAQGQAAQGRAAERQAAAAQEQAAQGQTAQGQAAQGRAAERQAAAAQDQAAQGQAEQGQAAQGQRGRPARRAAGGRARRSSVPSWDEIMFGTSRQPE